MLEIISIILAISLGTILGIFTGLTPGIHINIISSLIVAYSAYLLKIADPITISIIIISMSVTHTILDIIPSTLLGIPNSDNLTMLLPAHKLTLEGKAKLAIYYGIVGSILGIIITVIFTPILIFTIPFIYTKIKEAISIILIAISFYVIFKGDNKVYSLIFFLTSGIIGVLSFSIKTIDQPLLPLLSGLFGLSALILSIQNKIEISDQKQNIKLEVENKSMFKYSFVTMISSFLTNFLPGLTSSHTALISNKLSKVEKQEDYIILSNAANSSAVIISFIAFYTIAKTRSGSVATIQYLINSINLDKFILFIAVSLITIILATTIALKSSNFILKNINRINYQKLSICIISLIISLVLIMTRFEGLLILATTTSFGILADKLKIERINLTGCLIFPVIFYLI